MVDDNAAMREALARSLVRRGCRVTTAPDGVAALQVLKERSFDAVITDLNMPERGGLWLWRGATALRPELFGRFVFCGANGLPDSFDGPFRSERFLSDPLDLSILWAEIHAVTHGDGVESS